MTVVASKYERKTHDLYETEDWVTWALLRHFPIGHGTKVWEPAAGNHKMADVFVLAGAQVRTSDIETYRRSHTEVYDFLGEGAIPDALRGCNALITNPPFGKGNRDAVRFAENALGRCPGFVALLLTAKFDFGKTRYHLFRDNPRFCGKIALTDRIQWFAGDSGGTEDHAWYCWSPVRDWESSPMMLYADRRDGAV